MKTKCFLIFVSALFYNALAHGQDINISSDTLVWEVDQLEDLATDTTVSYSCQFISYGDNRVEWVQGDNYVIELPARSVDGSWPAEPTGQVEYAVRYMDRGSKLTFVKDLNGVFVKMYFVEDGNNTTPYSMHISSFHKKTL